LTSWERTLVQAKVASSRESQAGAWRSEIPSSAAGFHRYGK
jgi:hypothetical protein